MEAKDHLPLYGPGPLYVASIIALTTIALLFNWQNLIPVLDAGPLSAVFKVAAVLLIVECVVLYVRAVFMQRIDRSIKDNELATTGVYACVRNPIYSAFTFLCTAILLWVGNCCLLVLPVIFWILLTILLRATEERWLKDAYGAAYDEYCAQVNRVLPWFPRKG